MRFVGTKKQTEGLPGLLAVTQEVVNEFKIGILPLSKSLPIEDLPRSYVGLPALRYPVAQWLQVLNHTLGTSIHVGVIGIRTAFYRIKARVDMVTRWRTHGCRLKAA